MDDLITSLSDTFIVLAGALAIAAIAYWAVSALMSALARRTSSKVIADFLAPEAEAAPARMGSAAYKIRTAFAPWGIDAAGKEEAVFYGVWAAIGIAVLAGLLVLKISLVLAIVAGAAIGYFGVQAIIAGRWEKTRMEVDAEIPTFMRNLSGIVQAEQNVLSALESARESLAPDRPLYDWIGYLIQTVQAHGAGVYDALLEEAGEISSALVVVVYEIKRLHEAGGSGYIRALRMTADNLAETLTVKAQAASKAAGATGLAKLIIGASVFSLGYILTSDVGKDLYLGNPMVQLGMVAAVAWGVYGWIYIKEMVREATE